MPEYLSAGGLMAEQLTLNLESVAPPRPELRELWTPDDILATIVRNGALAAIDFPEDNRVEWKAARYDCRQLGDYFSMWANTQPHGGLIVLGLEKDGVISGCRSVGSGKLADLETTGPNYCPDAQFDVRRVPATLSDGTPDFILLIRVLYRPDRLVETVSGDAFVRVGNRKRRLTEEEKRELRIVKGQIVYEKEYVSLKFPDEIDTLLIREFCNEYRMKRGLGTRHSDGQILVLNHLVH